MFKKITALVLTLALLASPSFASVGFKKDGVSQGAITDLNFRSAGSSISSDGSTLTFNLIVAGTGNGGAVSMATNETTISTSYALVRKEIAADAAYGSSTLGDGYNGQIITFLITGVSGSGTWVVTPTTKTGFSTLTFDAAKDQATLMFVNSTVGWVILSTQSVTVALSAT